MPYSFRCNSCNSLETGDHAGERDVPLRCRVCGKGARYEISPAGAPVMVTEPDNWTVLADLDGNGIADILEFHGLERSDVVAHVPFVTTATQGSNGEVVLVTAVREGSMVEPANPRMFDAEAAENLAMEEALS